MKARNSCPTLSNNKAYWLITLIHAVLPKIVFLIAAIFSVLVFVAESKDNLFGFGPMWYAACSLLFFLLWIIARFSTGEMFVTSHLARGGAVVVPIGENFKTAPPFSLLLFLIRVK